MILCHKDNYIETIFLILLLTRQGTANKIYDVETLQKQTEF